jgi:hypothetical protein
MKKALILFVLLLLSNISKSQSLISSTGASVGDQDYHFSYSVGEIVVCTIFSDEAKITQGFQQPFENKITGLEDNKIESEVSIYPNPVFNALNINSKYGSIKKIRIFDNQGKQILEFENIQKQLNLDFLPPSLYFLVIYDLKNNVQGIHKIIKL